jgi:hypothetical protein
MFTPPFTPVRGEHYLLFRRMKEGRENSTPGDNFTPKGTKFPLGDNFTPTAKVCP